MDCGSFGSAEPLRSRRRPMSTSLLWNLSMFELPGVIEDGMPGWNVQRKPGTARGSPRRSRAAKASRISRRAVKSRCCSPQCVIERFTFGRKSGISRSICVNGAATAALDRGSCATHLFHRANNCQLAENEGDTMTPPAKVAAVTAVANVRAAA